MFRNKYFKQFIVITVLILFTICLSKWTSTKASSDPFQLTTPLEKGHKAYLVSEYHGVQVDNEIRFYFLTQLHENEGIDTLLLEVSISTGYLLNEYVHTGNITLLNTIFSFYEGTPFWTKEDFAFYEQVYQYNLSQTNPITLVGVDLELELSSTKVMLDALENEPQTLFNRQMELLVTKNIAYQKQFYETLDFQFRDLMMFQNYLTLQDIYLIDGFYGQFGLVHCLKYDEQYQSFAYLLNTDSKSNVKEDVFVILTYYNACQWVKTVYCLGNLYYYSSDVINNWEIQEAKAYVTGTHLILSDDERMDAILIVNHSQAATPLQKTYSFHIQTVIKRILLT